MPCLKNWRDGPFRGDVSLVQPYRMDAAGALKQSPLFAGFTDTGIAIMAGICSPKTIPPGALLFAESTVSESMWVVADGRVTLTMRGSLGDLALGELGPGDWLGELSLINSGQRQCTATAKTPVQAFEIRQADFQKLVASKPQACMKLLMSICAQYGQKVAANKDAIKTLVSKV
jgi:CRP/FNR family transcriptional regulator, cyclic AMP receptor protein